MCVRVGSSFVWSSFVRTQTQGKTQTLEAITLPAPWLKDGTIVPVPFELVSLADVCIFRSVVVGAQGSSRAGETELRRTS